MEKIEEIKNVLTFYTLSNKLKTTIIDDNYSEADHIFGSMILAVAMDSEYKETQNLGKILRMLFLSEFDKTNPTYKYSNLKSEKKLQDEIIERYSLQTNDARLAFKYEMLDFILTTLITKKNVDINYSKLEKEANNIFTLFGTKDKQKNEEIFKFYYLNSRLKNKVRSGWDNNHWNVKTDRIERISEHIIGTIALAIAMQSEFEYDFDLDRVLKILVLHEIGETLIGDITPFDGITKERKKQVEHQAMIEVLGNLSSKSEMLKLLFEFDEHETKDAKFSYYDDKIEADLQAKMYQDKGLHRSLDDQKNNCVFNNEKVKKMLEEGATTAFDIWYGWDKAIYEKDEHFPEFSLILKIIKDNNLLDLTEDNYVTDKTMILQLKP